MSSIFSLLSVMLHARAIFVTKTKTKTKIITIRFYRASAY